MTSVPPVSSAPAGLDPVTGTAAEVLALLREWDAAADPAPLVVETSGSTGRPKGVVLSRDAMRASALATLDRLGGPGRWLLTLPPTYVAGLQVLYRCVVAGTEPVVTDGPLERAGPAEARPLLGPGRSYVSVVPTQLHRWLRDDDQADALAAFDAVLVGGAALDPAERELATGRGVRIVRTYGMSETCGGCVYDGRPLAGAEVAIGEDGRVLLRGPMLFDGYRDDPGLTAQSLRDGWLVTGDLGTYEDGVLRVLGRADDVIVSGGVKVPAAAVERALAAHPGVERAQVVGVPDQEWGERVVALVSLTTPREAPDLAELRDLVEPRAWAPKALAVVERWPELANGKLDRLALRRLAADA